ncbi:haloacid dehalogenase type II [Salinicola aestuarinus]|uniref:haloacid dehalogenase type II n=1 Tax=Salinicola aestuarinus TaxID=1949082 RepID=UPI000DA15EE2|nr:haloacid dehalogenase type II [Salinicola aestuarinus]
MYLVFDVNETLLDTAALDPLFSRRFGDAALRPMWFLTLQEAWMTTTLTDRFEPFATLARRALRQLGAARGIEVTAADEEELVERVLTMPAHAGAAETLERLGREGHTLTALTNSALDAARDQLTQAGLIAHFDAVLSVESVSRYKPDPAPYRHAADHWGVTTEAMVMIAAHGWDLLGANAAGMKTAFIARPGKAMDSDVEGVPDWRDDDLERLMRRVVTESRE